MKIAISLCVIFVLTIFGLSGCSRTSRANAQVTKNQRSNMDSPIIISDGSSTHLKHQDKSGASSDFKITTLGGPGGVTLVTVNDSTYAAQKLICENRAVCNAGKEIALVPGWTMDVFDGSASPIKIMTVASPSTSANAVVTANYFTNKIDPQPDGSGDTTGTAIIQHDFTFNSASMTNGDGKAYPITCKPMPSPTPVPYSECRIHIVYQ